MTEPRLNSEGERLLNRMDSVHTITVDELVSWCVRRGLEPEDVTVTAAHLKWESPETAVEKERREAWAVRNAERTEAWERETWERLNARYGPREGEEGDEV